MEGLRKFILQQLAARNISPLMAKEYLEDITTNRQAKRVDIAIAGLACRFPDADSPEEYFRNLLTKLDSVKSFPAERVEDALYVNQSTFQKFNGFKCRVGTYLEKVCNFDCSFFGIPPIEAKTMDPAHRIFLQVAYEAIENSGLTLEELKGSKTGVFVGYSISEDNYIDLLKLDDPNVSVGNQPSLLPYRLAYFLDLTGPTMIIDTACSSSLVAVHQAALAIKSGDCDRAIVGGVNLRIFPAIREIGNLGIEAFDGRCKTFDAAANGTNIGEGVGVVVLRKLSDYQESSLPPLALLAGSAINSDGESNGLTAPSPKAQAQVITKAWRNSGFKPDDIDFIEAHGTGTKLGDPIEVLGIAEALKQLECTRKDIPLTAAKTSVGHLEATAGIAGMISVLMSMKNKTIPGNVHFQKPNPYIDFENSPVYPNIEAKKLDMKNPTIKAGISSFGISGTNAHVVLESYESFAEQSAKQESAKERIFLFSAKSLNSLRGIAGKYIQFLSKNEEIDLHDLAYSLAYSRSHFDCRLVIFSHSLRHLIKKLEQFLENRENGNVSDGEMIYSEDDWSNDLVLHKTGRSHHIISTAQLYLEKKIAREDFEDVFKGKMISLPSYYFDESRYWPKLTVSKPKNSEESVKEKFYDLMWKQESLKECADIKNSSFQNVIFFTNGCEEHLQFIERCKARGLKTITIFPGVKLEETDRGWRLDYRNPDHYDQLLEILVTKRNIICSGFIHMLECIKPRSEKQEVAFVKDSQILGAFSLFHLVNAMNKRLPKDHCRLAYLSSYAMQIQEGDVVNPTKMPGFGVCKVASQELPLLNSIAMDVPLEELVNEKATIFEEIFLTPSYLNGFVGYRSGLRFVQYLTKKKIHESSLDSPIKEDGVYLIAGGAGYLGIQTALNLAIKKRVHCILAGRKKEPVYTPQQKAAIQEIRNLGSTVCYMQSDVSDELQCEKLIETIEKEYKTINGIFLAVKSISHKKIADVKFDEFAAHIHSKLFSTLNLDKSTSRFSIDFMATFSSISSLTGGPTGADCCASNLFLDSYGPWKSKLGRKTITMNFTLIEADDGSLLSDRMSMIPPLSKEELQTCLSLCIDHRLDFSIMADFNSHVMQKVLPLMKINFDEELLNNFYHEKKALCDKSDQNVVEEAKKTSTWTLEEIQKLMQKIWSEVLGFESVTPEANFFEIGGESISAVKLIHMVEAQLEIAIEIGDLYANPQLSKLSLTVFERQSKGKDKDEIAHILDDLDLGKIDIAEATKSLEKTQV